MGFWGFGVLGRKDEEKYGQLVEYDSGEESDSSSSDDEEDSEIVKTSILTQLSTKFGPTDRERREKEEEFRDRVTASKRMLEERERKLTEERRSWEEERREVALELKKRGEKLEVYPRRVSRAL